MSRLTIELKDVSKQIDKFWALRDVSFDVVEGETLGFIGPNGSGKTTTAMLILGMYRPTSGSILTFGADPAIDFQRIGSRVGIMLEKPGMLSKLTAFEYLEFFGGILGIRSTDLTPRIRELLELVRLSDRARSYVDTFSKGMQQRICLARCLLNRPGLMVLDEPFDGLDVESRRVMLDTLSEASKEQGTAVFITSHNLAEVEEISDRVAIIKDGHIAAIDEIMSLKKRTFRSRRLVVNLAEAYPSNAISRFARLGEYHQSARNLVFDLDTINGSKDELLKQLLESGISINSFGEESTSLEDVYFAVIRDPHEGSS
jgi:ABC-2 type transport system ATP-binding protein